MIVWARRQLPVTTADRVERILDKRQALTLPSPKEIQYKPEPGRISGHGVFYRGIAAKEGASAETAAGTIGINVLERKIDN